MSSVDEVLRLVEMGEKLLALVRLDAIQDVLHIVATTCREAARSVS